MCVVWYGIGVGMRKTTQSAAKVKITIPCMSFPSSSSGCGASSRISFNSVTSHLASELLKSSLLNGYCSFSSNLISCKHLEKLINNIEMNSIECLPYLSFQYKMDLVKKNAMNFHGFRIRRRSKYQDVSPLLHVGLLF